MTTKRTKKETADPNHKAGKYTGYEVRNGKYFIAPIYRQEMDTLLARMRGIDTVLKAVITFSGEDSARIQAERMTLWKRIEEDLALDISVGEWQYDYVHGCIYRVEAKP